MSTVKWRVIVVIVVLTILSMGIVARSQSTNSKTDISKDELIKQLKAQIEQLQVAIKTQEAEIRRLTQLQGENTKTRRPSVNQLLKGNTNKERSKLKNVVPFTGEETPLTMVKAYTKDYIGKTFIIIGAIQVEDYYNFKYGNAQDTHVSLGFTEMRQDLSLTGVAMWLYAKKTISKKLVDHITYVVARGFGGDLIRAKVTILPDRYDNGQWSMAELIDWQFRSPDGKGWQDWVVGSKKVEEHPEEYLSEIEPEPPKHGEKGRVPDADNEKMLEALVDRILNASYRKSLGGPLELAGRWPLPTAEITEYLTETPVKVFSKPMFGIYLGEKIGDVKKRFEIKKISSNKDESLEIWFVSNKSDTICGHTIFTFEKKVVAIFVLFMDDSKSNHDAIIKQLEETYTIIWAYDLGMAQYQEFLTKIDDMLTLITLDHQFFEGKETLRIIYTHCPLAIQCRNEIRKRKAQKVSGDL